MELKYITEKAERKMKMLIAQSCPKTVAHQILVSMKFSRQEYLSQ